MKKNKIDSKITVTPIVNESEDYKDIREFIISLTGAYNSTYFSFILKLLGSFFIGFFIINLLID